MFGISGDLFLRILLCTGSRTPYRHRHGRQFPIRVRRPMTTVRRTRQFEQMRSDMEHALRMCRRFSFQIQLRIKPQVLHQHRCIVFACRIHRMKKHTDKHRVRWQNPSVLYPVFLILIIRLLLFHRQPIYAHAVRCVLRRHGKSVINIQ